MMKNLKWKGLAAALLLAACCLVFMSVAVAEDSQNLKSFKGTVVGTTAGDLYMAMVEASDGTRAEFVINAATYVDKDASLLSGAAVVIYYDYARKISENTYPRYAALAVVKPVDGFFTTLGVFNNDLVNSSNDLKLNLSPETEIISPNGEKFSGDIINKTLLVFYGATTRSIPAITTPTKIVVFSGETTPVPPIATLPPEGAPPSLKGTFGSFTGKVTAAESTPGIMYLMLEDTSGQKARFAIYTNAHNLNGARYEVGQNLIAFYDKSAPATMIYPPQYTAHSLAAASEDLSIFVGQFDQDNVSFDGALKITPAATTEFVMPDGTKYEGALQGKTVAVFYAAATRSIPAITTPQKIMILPEYQAAMPLPITVAPVGDAKVPAAGK